MLAKVALPPQESLSNLVSLFCASTPETSSAPPTHLTVLPESQQRKTAYPGRAPDVDVKHGIAL